MIEQIRADFSQFVADCDFSKPDSNEEELNALKEHVAQLESRGNRTSLALNDLSTSIFNELKAKQVTMNFDYTLTRLSLCAATGDIAPPILHITVGYCTPLEN